MRHHNTVPSFNSLAMMMSFEGICDSCFEVFTVVNIWVPSNKISIVCFKKNVCVTLYSFFACLIILKFTF